MQKRDHPYIYINYQIQIYNLKHMAISTLHYMHSNFQQSCIVCSENWQTDIPHLLSILL